MTFRAALKPHCIRLPALLALAVTLVSCGGGDEPASTVDAPGSAGTGDTRPNIVYILVDDLGFADLSVFGSEIQTPNIDSLARSGMILTDFHTSLACSPTRAMFMSGTDNHVAGLGVMSPTGREDQAQAPGYEAHLNFRVASLASLMSDAGYNTYMSGKWHLGDTVETGPVARGFKRVFASFDGAAHLGGLSWDGPELPGLASYWDGEDVVNVGDDFYSTHDYTERMIGFIEQDRDDNKPFFAWLAYTAPHWPLQAPPESIAPFAGRYDEGYTALYAERYRRMQQLGWIDADATMPDHDWEQPWNELSDEDQRIAARRMEIYAAMVVDLDQYIGEFVDYLRSIGEYDNTLIVFSSDNGAEPNRRELAAPLSDWVAACCDNSYDNLGAADSYVMYGEDWATAGTVAYRRHKGTAFEGGIRVPAFASLPGVIESGQVSDALMTVMDLMPTFLELADAEHPGSTYQGREIAPIQGRSVMPVLRGESSEVHPPEHVIGWELYGHRAVRQGDWKIVWDEAAEEPEWMLFDLASDPAEQNDLAAANPEKLAEMTGAWDQYAEESGVVY